MRLNSKKLLLLLTVVAVAAIPLQSAMAAAWPVQGAVTGLTGVTPTNGCVGFRQWSQQDSGAFVAPTTCSGGTTSATCAALNASVGNGSGNVCWNTINGTGISTGYQDNISNYNLGQDNQPMTEVVEMLLGGGTPGYAGYYYHASQFAIQGEVGNVTNDLCTGSVATATYCPGSVVNRGPAQLKTKEANDLAPVGGFNAIAEPRITSTTAGSTALNWDPPFFKDRDGAVTPFKGWKVYRFNDTNGNNTCEPPTDLSAWVLIGFTATPNFTDPGVSTGQDCHFYSLRMAWNGPPTVAKGPDALVGEVSSLNRGAASAPVSSNPLAAQIINFAASYSGKNVIRLSWVGQVETGVAGFKIGRGTDVNGPFQVTSDLISAQGNGSSYNFSHKVNRKEGTTYFYQLSVVHTDGSVTFVGPVKGSVPKPKN